MHVDRSRFLVLTMSIASSSCAPAQPPGSPSEASGTRPPPVVDVAAPDDRPIQFLAGTGQAPSSDGRALGQEAPRQDGAGWGLGGVSDLEPPDDGSEWEDAASLPTGATAPLNTKLAERCRGLRPPPGPHCESFLTTVPECEDYERALEPAAAERAVRCLTRKSGTQGICKFGVTADCFLQAARPEPTTADAQRRCAPVVRACGAQRWREPDLTAANCHAAVSSVRPELRSTLVSCIAESCGVASCYYDISSF